MTRPEVCTDAVLAFLDQEQAFNAVAYGVTGRLEHAFRLKALDAAMCVAFWSASRAGRQVQTVPPPPDPAFLKDVRIAKRVRLLDIAWRLGLHVQTLQDIEEGRMSAMPGVLFDWLRIVEAGPYPKPLPLPSEAAIVGALLFVAGCVFGGLAVLTMTGTGR